MDLTALELTLYDEMEELERLSFNRELLIPGETPLLEVVGQFHEFRAHDLVKVRYLFDELKLPLEQVLLLALDDLKTVLVESGEVTVRYTLDSGSSFVLG